MKILAVDATQTIEPERVLELVSSTGAHRAFLFGAAARGVAHHLEARRTADDDRFLDETAAYLLESGERERPRRRGLPPVAARLVAVLPTGTAPLAALRSTDRAVEMRGRALVMGVARRADLEGESLDNAYAWIVGGERAPLLAPDGASPVVAPGAADEAGTVLVVELLGTEAAVEVLDLNGAPQRREVLAKPALRLSVQG